MSRHSLLDSPAPIAAPWAPPWARGGLLLLALVASACTRADGVLAYSFALGPSPGQVVPSPAELGRDLRDGVALASGRGRVDVDVPTKVVRASMSGLPVIAGPSGAYYQVVLVLGDSVIRPQRGVIHALRRLWPIAVAQAHESRAVLGSLLPSDFGTAALFVQTPGFDLSRVVGGQVEIVIPGQSGELKSYPVYNGEIGNLDEVATAPEAPGGAGGHQH